MKDYLLERDSEVATRVLNFATTPGSTTTKRPFAVHRLNHGSIITGLETYARVLVGVVTIDGMIVPSFATGAAKLPITTPALAINATAAKFQVGAFSWRRGNGIFYTAIQLALVFSAADTIAANKFGIWLVQITDAGVISTKPAAGAMSYNSAALALAALPAADASNTPIGTIAVAAGGGGFTAATTALTTIATFTSYLATDTKAFTAAITVVAGKPVAGVLSVTETNTYGNAGDQVVLMATGDGTGALTDGLTTLRYRPHPLKGEAIR